MRPFRFTQVKSSPLLPYAAAVGSVLFAVALYFVLGPGAQRTSLALFLGAVGLAAWIGGSFAGVLATFLSFFTATYFFPGIPSDLGDPATWQRFAVFMLAGLLISAASYGRNRAERALRAQGARLETTLASIGDAVISTDAEGRVAFMNPVAEKLTGWSEEEAVGKDLPTVFKIISQETREPVENPFAKVVRTRGVTGLANHTLIIARDGTERPIDDSGSPIRDDKGNIVGVVLVFRDVTERMQAEQEREDLLKSEQRARASAEAATHRLAFLAEASEVLSSSLDYQTTLGSVTRLAVPEMADWCAVDLATESGILERLAVAHVDPAKVEWAHELQRRFPPNPNSPTGAYKVLRTGQPEFYPTITEEMMQASGVSEEQLKIVREIGFTSAIVAPMSTQDRTLGVLTLVSAESGKHYDEEDVTLVRDLARRAANAVENARLYNNAESAIRARDHFVSVASHELKTPLSSLIGYTQLVQRRTRQTGTISERDSATLDNVVKQARRLDRMVNSLLDLSRIETGQLSIESEPVDVCDFARRVVQEVRPTFEERYTLELNCPPGQLIVEGDELRLEQVLQNLIQNAAKYSPEGGPVTVTVEHKEQEKQVCIAVADKGIGIPQDSQQRLFSRFFRAPNAQMISGMGIGLYVVKEIVTLHGGTINVESKQGEGSTFTVCLPLMSRGEG
jgi:PAS domain S-box-containing protein